MKNIHWLTFALVLCICCDIGWAHRLRVFAELDGDRILGEAIFSGGHPAKGVNVIVYDEEEHVLLSRKTNEQGKFFFSVTELKFTGGEVVFVAETEDGHRGQWSLGLDIGNETKFSVGEQDISVTKKNSSEDDPTILGIVGGIFSIFCIFTIMNIFLKRKQRGKK